MSFGARGEPESQRSKPYSAAQLDLASSALENALITGRDGLKGVRAHLRFPGPAAQTQEDLQADAQLVEVIAKLAKFANEFPSRVGRDALATDGVAPSLRATPATMIEFGLMIERLAPEQTVKLLLAAYSLARANGDALSKAHALSLLCEREPESSDVFSGMLEQLLEINVEDSPRLGVAIAKVRGLVAAARRIDLTDEEMCGSDLAVLVGRVLQINSDNRTEIDGALHDLPCFIYGNDDSTCWERAKRAAQFDSPLQIVKLLMELSDIAVEFGKFKQAAGLLRILERRLSEAELDSGLLKETLLGVIGARQGLILYGWSQNATDVSFDGRPIEVRADESLRDSIAWLEFPPSSIAKRLDGLAPAEILGFELEELLASAFFALADLNEFVIEEPTLKQVRAMRADLRASDLWAKRLSATERWKFEDRLKDLNATLKKREKAASKRDERASGKRDRTAGNQDRDLDADGIDDGWGDDIDSE